MAKRVNADAFSEGDGDEVNADDTPRCFFTEPDKAAVVAQLKKPSTFGKTEKKKNLLKVFIEKRSEFVTLLEAANDPDLVTRFTNVLPSMSDLNNARITSLEKVCKIMYVLKEIFHKLRSKIALPKTRRLVNPIETLENAVSEATSNARDDNTKDAMACFIKLKGADRLRKFDESKRPTDEAHHKCASCGHELVDVPGNHTEIMARNIKRMEEWKEKKDAYDAAKAKGKSYKDKDGKVLTRAPPCPTKQLETILHVCHCHQMRCLDFNSDIGSSCPLLCINPLTGTRFGPDPVTGGCSCPLCQCSCDKAYKVSQVLAFGASVFASATPHLCSHPSRVMHTSSLT